MEFDIDKLDELQMVENDGKGIVCVKHIISCLKKNDVDMAKQVYQIEGDKIISYPLIQQWMVKNFGCRIHWDKDCKSSLCMALNEHNENRIKRNNF